MIYAQKPKKIKTMGMVKKVRLVETNTPELLGEVQGEFGSEGSLYGYSAYQKSITRAGIKKERLLRKTRKLPK